jgi:poly-gamma-glutamate capsule biosynthesis protein CapA/YwtB (metallophosphatase superfamily)
VRRVRTVGGAVRSAVLLGALFGVVACGRSDAGAVLAAPDPDPPHTAPDPDLPSTAGSEERTSVATPDDGTATDHSGSLEGPTERRFTIAAVGDVLPHGAVIARAEAYGQETGYAFDFRPMFAEVAPIVQAADLAICNLETPLAIDHAAVSHRGFPLFNAPRELGEALADAGFDACSTANNHATDAGVDGVIATLEVLDDVGIAGAGTGRTPEEAASPRWHTVRDVTVAHLAASGWVNVALPAGSGWMVELIDVDRLVAQADAAREAGAEFVVVSLHHGIEYQPEPSEGQRSRAEALLASGAIDLVLGHHAHVVQPIERLDDGVAVHGLGNLLSNQRADVTGPETEDGVIVLLEVGEVAEGTGLRVTDVAYVPTWVDRERHVIVDVWATLGSPALDPERRVTLVDSWRRTVAAITRDGADAWGATPTSGTAWFEGRGTAGITSLAGAPRDATVVLTGGG